QHVEEGRLARAVRADQAVDLALADREAHLRERDEAAEALGDPLDLQDVGLFAHATLGASSTASSRLRTAEGRMPAGRKSIITTIARPKSSMRITSGSMIDRPNTQRCTGSTV